MNGITSSSTPDDHPDNQVTSEALQKKLYIASQLMNLSSHGFYGNLPCKVRGRKTHIFSSDEFDEYMTPSFDMTGAQSEGIDIYCAAIKECYQNLSQFRDVDIHLFPYGFNDIMKSMLNDNFFAINPSEIGAHREHTVKNYIDNLYEYALDDISNKDRAIQAMKNLIQDRKIQQNYIHLTLLYLLRVGEKDYVENSINCLDIAEQTKVRGYIDRYSSGIYQISPL